MTEQAMVNEIKIFSNPDFGEIRTAGTSDKPLFCLADLCRALDLANVSQVRTRLDDGVISNEVIVDKLGRTQTATFVTESGMYDVAEEHGYLGKIFDIVSQMVKDKIS